MNRIYNALLAAILATATLTACAAFRHADGGIDLGKVADEVALIQQDVADLAPLASLETQEKIANLAATMAQVEVALRAADTGAAVGYAEAALALADVLAAELAPDSDLRFGIALARVALRHLAAADWGAVEPVADEAESGVEAGGHP